ncbi:NAD(+) diphosphatase [Breoghania sp. L-A4]|uniref:NAD(+) diphosphatase n=1 Tax=Breoghania sp. L-A4 TaxID=2304600 RepID=UPI000E35AEDD|nr:NAD(+) diphosphatase [Breoghania sp. L-A4]AXS39024.1 NAD(+) diphosphatase [Breoghania sp. L-A4]
MSFAHPSDPSVLLGFAANDIDRLADKREDAAWIAAARDGEAARFLLFCGDRPVIGIGESLRIGHARALAEALQADFDDCPFLGSRDGPAFFSAGIPLGETAEESVEAAGALKLIDLRSLAVDGQMPAGDVGLLAQGRSLLHWHQTHRFCSRCGTRSILTQGGYRRDCPSCGGLHFPRTDPVAIMLTVDGDRCLLGRQPRFVEGMYSALAGFIEPGETIEAAVRRETWEEAGIRAGRVSYYASQPWPFPASLMIGCIVEALTTGITMDATELDDCRWFHRDDVALMLPRTHPDGLIAPPPMAIAHILMKAFVDGEV